MTSHTDQPDPTTVRGLMRLDPAPPAAAEPASAMPDPARDALAWQLARVIAATTTPWGTWDGDAGYHLRQSSKAAADAVLAHLGDAEPEAVRVQRIRADVAEQQYDRQREYGAAHGRELTRLIGEYRTQTARARVGTQEPADVDNYGEDGRYLSGVTEGLRIARRVWVNGPVRPDDDTTAAAR